MGSSTVHMREHFRCVVEQCRDDLAVRTLRKHLFSVRPRRCLHKAIGKATILPWRYATIAALRSPRRCRSEDPSNATRAGDPSDAAGIVSSTSPGLTGIAGKTYRKRSMTRSGAIFATISDRIIVSNRTGRRVAQTADREATPRRGRNLTTSFHDPVSCDDGTFL